LNNFLLPNKKTFGLQIPQIVAVKRIDMCLELRGKVRKLNCMLDMDTHIIVIELMRQLAHKSLQFIHNGFFFRIVKTVGLHKVLLPKLQESHIESRTVAPQCPHHSIGAGPQTKTPTLSVLDDKSLELPATSSRQFSKPLIYRDRRGLGHWNHMILKKNKA